MTPKSIGKPRTGKSRHVCVLYRSKDTEDGLGAIAQALEEGVRQDDRMVAVCDGRLTHQLKRLERDGFGVERLILQGRLEIRAWDETYLQGGQFHQHIMLALVENVLKSASKDVRAPRIIADMGWALSGHPGADKLIEFEARLNYVVPKYDAVIVCLYDLSRFDAVTIMDVLRTHPFALTPGGIQSNPFFVPSDDLLYELLEKKI